MSKEAAARLLERLDGVSEREVAAIAHPWYYKSYLLFTWLDDLVRSDAILDRVASVLGPDILMHQL